MKAPAALAATTGRAIVSGVVGAVAYDVARCAVRRVPKREVAVRSTAWGLKGFRGAERGAEVARLRTADIVAEARERIGEQAPPPGPASAGHDHDH